MEQVGRGAVLLLLEKMQSPEVPLPTRAVAMRLREGMTCQKKNLKKL